PVGRRVFLLGMRIDVGVYATHPFADTITGNAAIACRAAGIPLLRLSRPGRPHPAGGAPAFGFPPTRLSVAPAPGGRGQSSSGHVC
ncbi:precorrin-6A/cobalt-precorrin-6A reductase, partial [Nocardia cyriacigeorgica]|uniref:precorrin-6A/cobalt-precorrin-6A reductase n=1 Tax=Nocardia cyriacigeorgica TaxID=135487 RepID=UPI003CC7F03E